MQLWSSLATAAAVWALLLHHHHHGSGVRGFQVVVTRRRIGATLSAVATQLNVASVSPPPPPPQVNSDTTVYDCDDELEEECTPVDICDELECRTTLDIRLHGIWYDLSGWRKAHPAGTHWLDWYDGRDATDVMDAFHSDKARNMYQRLPRSNPNTATALETVVEEDTPIQKGFRKLRDQLIAEGFYERDMKHEATQLGLWAACVVGAMVTAHSLPFVATCFLSISMTAAGWLGHDYIHGIDNFCNRLRNFAPLAAGLAPTWWSDKHNKHHALTNEQGADEDIATDPFLYTWAPDPSQDSPLRKIQHYIFWVPFSFLFALWRVDSITSAVDGIEQKRRDSKTELYCLLAHYAILLTVFPVAVWLPSIFVSGLISALIVTPTHQSEDMFADYQADWVTAQFQSTRNAVTSNPFSEWIWGGMQYQLEHHLFPSMPRHQYPKLKQRLQQFCREYNVPGGYRESGEWEILKMNWDLYRQVANQEAVPGAPLTRGRPGQLAAIDPSLGAASIGEQAGAVASSS